MCADGYIVFRRIGQVSNDHTKTDYLVDIHQGGTEGIRAHLQGGGCFAEAALTCLSVVDSSPIDWD
jgi:hypothetical protein